MSPAVGSEGDARGCVLVACSLALAAADARPGETVTALLQVSCAQPDAVELQEVEIEFTGIERVDTSWVLPTYRRATPPINTDKRKVQRHVVQSRLQAATQGTFSDLTLRRFVVKFALPSWLPPTFRGTAVRYVYYLQAVVKYRPAPLASGSGADDAADLGPAATSGAGAGGTSSSVSTRAALHIWPARQQQQQLDSAGLEQAPLLLSPPGSGAAAAVDGSLPSRPIAAAETVPIKCWEIGPGTAVQDAVAHIARLALQPPASPGRPTSPGHLPRGSMLAGSAIGSAPADDVQSEISHEPDEAETNPAGSDSPAPGSASGLGAAATPQPPLPLSLPKQQQQQQQAPSSSAGSGAGTPLTERLLAQRPLVARRSLDSASALATPRSPTKLLLDSGSTLRSFALRIGDQPLVRVTLHPPLEGGLHPGVTLAGTLDFTPSLAAGGGGQGPPAGVQGPRCMQVLILLETEEAVEQPWRRQLAAPAGGGIRRVYDEHVELTADTACTHFLFTIPPDAPVSFHTPLLQLRWLLRFQFSASSPPAAKGGSSGGPSGDWNPLAGRLEQLSWTLPITVLPPIS